MSAPVEPETLDPWSDGAARRVANYLASLTEVRPLKEEAAFAPLLRARHPAEADEVLAEHSGARRGRAVGSTWAAKNRSLALTLDFSLAWYGDRLRVWLEWVTRELAPSLAAPPRRVLDLGCECGLLTCFYAALWPEAEVIGVDRVGPSLDRARELAECLGLANVRFVRADLARRRTPLLTDVDLAISTLALGHELARPTGGEMPALAGLRSALRPGGQFVSMERLSDTSATLAWVRLLEAHGLAVLLERGPTLGFHELGMQQTMPVLVCEAAEQVCPVDEAALGVARFTSLSPRHGNERVLPSTLGRAVLDAIPARRLAATARLESWFGPQASIDFWVTGPLLLVHRLTVNGSEDVVLDAAVRLPARLDALRRESAASATSEGLTLEISMPAG